MYVLCIMCIYHAGNKTLGQHLFWSHIRETLCHSEVSCIYNFLISHFIFWVEESHRDGLLFFAVEETLALKKDNASIYFTEVRFNPLNPKQCWGGFCSCQIFLSVALIFIAIQVLSMETEQSWFVVERTKTSILCRITQLQWRKS